MTETATIPLKEEVVSYQVCNFEYNGFYGRVKEGVAAYTAVFVKWTGDAGVGVFLCSDGKERWIPTFALPEFNMSAHPVQDKTGSFFGLSCKS